MNYLNGNLEYCPYFSGMPFKVDILISMSFGNLLSTIGIIIFKGNSKTGRLNKNMASTPCFSRHAAIKAKDFVFSKMKYQ